MPWGRIDDTFHSHPKVLGIPRPERAAVVGVYWLAISWSNAHGTDGLVPTAVLDELCGTPEIAAILVRQKLWHRSGTKGYRIHDFAAYSPTRAAVAERSALRSVAGRLGALKRWQTDSTSHEPNGKLMAGAMPLLYGSDSKRMANDGSRAGVPAPTHTPKKSTPPPPTSGGRRKDRTNPRAVGTSPRQDGTNPRSNGTSIRAERQEQKTGATSLREIMARLQAEPTPDDAAADDWFEPVDLEPAGQGDTP
ncbi:MAG TPA: hypothetical protein VLM76_13440 [Patescibacteria group bacterium]|nr:hypothetical protein [Patescibacteria group bacterium]